MVPDRVIPMGQIGHSNCVLWNINRVQTNDMLNRIAWKRPVF